VIAGVGGLGPLAYHFGNDESRATCLYNNKPDNVQVNDQVIRRRFVATASLCAGILLLAPRAWALTDFTPYATVGFEHNSNVFARPGGEPPFPATGNTRLGDTIERYLLGVETWFAWDRNRLTLDAQGQRFQYNSFGQLSHYEHKLDGKFDWHLSALVDGSLEYEDQRQMQSLADTLSDQLEIQHDRTATATVRLHATPSWRIDLQPKWHELDSPLPLYPQFGLREKAAAVSLNYLGINKLTAGLRVEYTDGAYHQIVAATKYHQTTAELTADYAVTGLSSFDGQLGYTRRSNALLNPAEAPTGSAGLGGVVGDTSALTGTLGFRRRLSVKTAVDLSLFREVDSYVAGANSEIGTGGDAGITWDPDVKFSFRLHYRLSDQSIQGQLAIANFANRSDRSQLVEFYVKYYARKWLTLRPYVTRNQRSSNFRDANFTATLVGVDLTARLQ
jgi:hypothetical protein